MVGILTHDVYPFERLPDEKMKGRIDANSYHRLQDQALSKGVQLIRRHYKSVSDLLRDQSSTTLLINCSGIGSLNLADIQDKNLYPTRGQTLLVAEPKKPINRMYEFERVKYDRPNNFLSRTILAFYMNIH